MKKWTDLNRHFFKDICMANKYMKFSVTNHQGNANQNHSDISPHISELAIIKKTRNNKCQRGSGQRKPCVLLTGMQMNAGTMENSMEGPQKVKNRTTVQSIQTPLLDVYLKKMKTLIRKDRCTSCVHCSITYSSKDIETT